MIQCKYCQEWFLPSSSKNVCCAYCQNNSANVARADVSRKLKYRLYNITQKGNKIRVKHP